MKYLLIQLLMVSFLFTFDLDDWTYFRKVGSIHSIIEDDNLVHFIASNGVYSYDDIEENYYYNYNLSHEIDFNNKIYHFYFDSNTNMYWLIDEYGLKMKHSFHSFWNDISYRKFNIIDVSEILDIGGSPNYIWIKLFNRIIPLHQITGSIINDNIDQNEIDNINWNNQYDSNGDVNIDLSRYVIFDGWNINYNQITNNRGDILVPTAFMEDKNGNIWVGTREGSILKGSVYSHRLEIINFGLKFDNITTTIIDDNMNWWFGDSQFLRTGVKRHKQNFRKNNYNFLAKWNEYENTWKYIETDYSMLIQNIDVNDMLSLNEILYIATMDGLLIFDEIDNSWIKIDINLYDVAIWDIEYYDNSIYVATSNGFDEISTISYKVINNNDDLSQLLRNSEIYDILISDEIIYIASDKGLFEKYFDVNNYKLLSNKKFKNIKKYKNNIFGNNRNIWKIDLGTLEIEKFESSVLNFSIVGDLIWLNHFDYCELLNINTRRNWEFNYDTGIIGSMIYNIESNKDRVWFMTNSGIAIYNWDISDYE